MADDDVYKGKSLLTEMFKIERTERRERPELRQDGTEPPCPPGEFPASTTGAEVLAADYEEQVGLAVECAFEKYVEHGPRVTELYGGIFSIVRAPRFYV